MLKFLNWAMRDGQAEAKSLGYVPLPDKVIAQIDSAWANELGGAWAVASTHLRHGL